MRIVRLMFVVLFALAGIVTVATSPNVSTAEEADLPEPMSIPADDLSTPTTPEPEPMPTVPPDDLTAFHNTGA